MTEFNHSSDPFDDIMAQFAGDSKLTELTGLLEEQDRITRLQSVDDTGNVDVKVSAYYKESLNDIAASIYATFQELCAAYDVDVNAPNPNQASFSRINQELAVIVYGLKRRLWLGDMLWATNAAVLDTRSDEADAVGAMSIGSGDAITGQFAGPAIGPMPDEFTMMTNGEHGNPPMGIGIALDNAAIVDKSGEVHRDIFEGRVIIALGNAGLDLQKLVHSLPPKDNR